MGVPTRVLFVCLGNICRSPLAEGLMRRHLEAQGLSDAFEIDSAGTGAWHVGEAPDRRMRQTARGHGVDLDHLRGRQITAADLERFDHIIVMDHENLANVRRLDRAGRYHDRVRLLRDYDPTPGDGAVPDPYYEGGFEGVYAIVERSTRALLEALAP